MKRKEGGRVKGKEGGRVKGKEGGREVARFSDVFSADDFKHAFL